MADQMVHIIAPLLNAEHVRTFRTTASSKIVVIGRLQTNPQASSYIIQQSDGERNRWPKPIGVVVQCFSQTASRYVHVHYAATLPGSPRRP